jgi:hypothetical protein
MFQSNIIRDPIIANTRDIDCKSYSVVYREYVIAPSPPKTLMDCVVQRE